MWSLYENKKRLEPLVFSNGKSQDDIVKEVLDAIKQGNKVIFIRGVCGTGKCLDRNSLIFCKPQNKPYFGYYKISDLIDTEGLILSLDSNGNLIETSYCNVRETGSKHLYELKTRTGREILASDSHPFLTITEKGVEWKPLKELSNNSYICLPNQIPESNTSNLDDNKIKILAHLIAEGKLGDKIGSPVYTQDPIINSETRKDYEDALKAVFPGGIIKSYNGKDVVITFGNKDTTSGVTNKLRLFVKEYGLDGKRSKEKFVPEIIFNLSKEKIALFLRTLFSGDGCIYKRKIREKEEIIIEYCSTSHDLIRGVSLLLNVFGIQHTVGSKAFRGDKNYSKRISISNHRSLRKFIENVGFIGRKQRDALNFYKTMKEHKYTNIDKVPRIIREYLKSKGYSYNQLDRFLNYYAIEEKRKTLNYKQIKVDKTIQTPTVFRQGKIDFLREHLSKVNEHVKNETIGFVCNKSIFWDKIKSINYLKEDLTYDMEVPRHHNFIADGIIAHNSAIALNIAKELGRTSIVVPIKNLQKQYEDDYSEKKHILRDNGQKLKIKVIKGRQNFSCPFLKENSIKEEKNSTLNIFDSPFKKQQPWELPADESCNNHLLPCKIEINKKNEKKIREYMKMNEKIKNNLSLSFVRRMSIAPVCKCYSPIVPSDINLGLDDARKIQYRGLRSINFIIYSRKAGCQYYEQYLSYINSDVLIFNSHKYKLETMMNRKPFTEVEIIDECDEFLDSFANSGIINMNRLYFALGYLFSDNEKTNKEISEITGLVSEIIDDRNLVCDRIIPLKETKLFHMLKKFLENDLMSHAECDEDNYCYHAEETAKEFADLFDETYVLFEREDKNLTAKIITINIKERFKEMLDKNKAFVLMSGTIHNERVLQEIFGLDNFKIIEAETKMPGSITKVKTGMEFNCNHQNLIKEGAREKYLMALSKCIEQAKPPVLVHVNSFYDLPNRKEAERFKLKIMTREELVEMQNDREIISKFKSGEKGILYSTKCNRGVDFPGEVCNSIIMTKYPYPDVKGLFWQLLKKIKPGHYSNFYLDKARREFMQRIYRGLRSEKDHVYLLSPDSRVLDANI